MTRRAIVQGNPEQPRGKAMGAGIMAPEAPRRQRRRRVREHMDPVHQALKRMAGKTEEPALFMKEMKRRLNGSLQQEMGEKIPLFETDFWAYINANGIERLPSSSIKPVIEQIFASI